MAFTWDVANDLLATGEKHTLGRDSILFSIKLFWSGQQNPGSESELCWTFWVGALHSCEKIRTQYAGKGKRLSSDLTRGRCHCLFCFAHPEDRFITDRDVVEKIRCTGFPIKNYRIFTVHHGHAYVRIFDIWCQLCWVRYAILSWTTMP